MMTSLHKTKDDQDTPATTEPVTPASNKAVPPAAGAHAATHLTNDDATPGTGALTSHTNASGKEVDGGAG